MTASQPEKVIHQLGDFIIKHSDEITQHWITVVNKDKEIPTSDYLTNIQLLDHLPQLFQQLCEFLHEQPQTKEVAPAAKKAAEIHGHHRKKQGYNIYELVRELGILRTTVMSEILPAFAQQSLDCTQAIERQARTLIDEFFNITTSTSVAQFAKEHEQDVTQHHVELEQINKQLQDFNKRLQESDQLRLSFIRTISHELGNILNSIIGPIGLLNQRIDTEQRTKMFGILTRNTRDMRTLLDQLNDYSVLLDGQEQLSIEIFELPLLIDELSDTFKPLAISKALEFEIILPDKKIVFVSDRLKIKRILTNLISNAIKYTKQGYVRIIIEEYNQSQCIIKVEDSGEGIKQENLPKLFTEFHRFTASKELPGTGLGLAISKRLVELLQGSIKVNSIFCQGSCFQIVLPISINNY